MQLYKIIEFLRKSTCRGLPKHISTFLVMFLLCFSNATYAGSFTASGSTLTLDLDVAGQLVTVASSGTTFTFTLSGGATNTWTGTTSYSVSVSGKNQLLVGIISKKQTEKSKYNQISIEKRKRV